MVLPKGLPPNMIFSDIPSLLISVSLYLTCDAPKYKIILYSYVFGLSQKDKRAE